MLRSATRIVSAAAETAEMHTTTADEAGFEHNPCAVESILQLCMQRNEVNEMSALVIMSPMMQFIACLNLATSGFGMHGRVDIYKYLDAGCDCSHNDM